MMTTTNLISITLLIVLTIILVVFYRTNLSRVKKERKRLQKCKSDTSQLLLCAVAGATDSSTSSQISISPPIKNDKFFNKDGQLIDMNEYTIYVVDGDSASFCGIKSGDILFVKDCSPSDLQFPCIVVIKSESENEDGTKYKVRMACGISSVNEIGSMVKTIMEQQYFEIVKNSERYSSDEEMIKESSERFRNGKYPNGKDDVLISVTSHHTNQDKSDYKMGFSIHPTHLIVGKVEEVYDISQKSFIESKTWVSKIKSFFIGESA
jgi:hypothetical protein